MARFAFPDDRIFHPGAAWGLFLLGRRFSPTFDPEEQCYDTRRQEREHTVEKAAVMNIESIAPLRLSIAVRAWNEEAVIRRTLESVFEQSLFEELCRRHERCEVICIPNGCSDRTAEIARAVFAEQARLHPFAGAFTCRVEEIREAGRNNTWNAFVHDLSSREAEFLYLMDSDILFNRRGTLFNMYTALLNKPEACIASDRQIKDICFKKNKSLLDRVSLATTDMTRTIEGQITGQLYCIRADVARRLYLPKDLGAPDDGFIKAIVCTDFFRRELNPARIVTAEGASHIYEAYTSARELLNNQKRQMIGQTTVHVLIEYLKTLPLEERTDLATTLKRKDDADPDWTKQLIHEHLRRTRYFWRLFPDLLTFRFRRWRKLGGVKRLTHFPAAMAGFVVTLIACARAHHHFKRGQMHYWPKASRENIQQLKIDQTRAARDPQLIKT
jgi:glycosyltransferase involved in cell wall biosynthesis